jgi:hypothetical protein
MGWVIGVFWLLRMIIIKINEEDGEGYRKDERQGSRLSQDRPLLPLRAGCHRPGDQEHQLLQVHAADVITCLMFAEQSGVRVERKA